MLCEEIEPDQLEVYQGLHYAERKYNGCRGLLDTRKTNNYMINNRRGGNYNYSLPELLEEMVEALPEGCVIDGEICVWRDNDVEDFTLAQRRVSTRQPSKVREYRRTMPVTFMAFDLIYTQGVSIYNTTYEMRKAMLEELIADIEPLNHIECVYNSPRLRQTWDTAIDEGWEGLVLKKSGSLYFPETRTWDWIKVKPTYNEIVTVIGYTKSTKRQFRSLVLVKDDKYMGHCGQGFSDEDLAKIDKRMLKYHGFVKWLELPDEKGVAVVPFKIKIKHYGLGPDGHYKNAIFEGIVDESNTT